MPKISKLLELIREDTNVKQKYGAKGEYPRKVSLQSVMSRLHNVEPKPPKKDSTKSATRGSAEPARRKKVPLEPQQGKSSPERGKYTKKYREKVGSRKSEPKQPEYFLSPAGKRIKQQTLDKERLKHQRKVEMRSHYADKFFKQSEHRSGLIRQMNQDHDDARHGSGALSPDGTAHAHHYDSHLSRINHDILAGRINHPQHISALVRHAQLTHGNSYLHYRGRDGIRTKNDDRHTSADSAFRHGHETAKQLLKVAHSSNYPREAFDGPDSKVPENKRRHDKEIEDAHKHIQYHSVMHNDVLQTPAPAPKKKTPGVLGKAKRFFGLEHAELIERLDLSEDHPIIMALVENAEHYNSLPMLYARSMIHDYSHELDSADFSHHEKDVLMQYENEYHEERGMYIEDVAHAVSDAVEDGHLDPYGADQLLKSYVATRHVINHPRIKNVMSEAFESIGDEDMAKVYNKFGKRSVLGKISEASSIPKIVDSDHMAEMNIKQLVQKLKAFSESAGSRGKRPSVSHSGVKTSGGAGHGEEHRTTPGQIRARLKRRKDAPKSFTKM